MNPSQGSFYEDSAVIGSCATLPRTTIVLDWAAKVRPSGILDLGCGDGATSVELQRVSQAEVTCADVSAEAVAQCRQKGLNAYQIEAGAGVLPFKDASFDLVVMGEVIEHLINPAQAMDEVHRVLRPDGYLILSTPNLACFPNRVLLGFGFQPLFSEASERHVLGRGLGALGQGGKPVGHLRLYTRRTLLEFLRECGFRPLKVQGSAFHEKGLLRRVESLAAFMSSFAMILVVLAQPGKTQRN